MLIAGDALEGQFVITHFITPLARRSARVAVLSQSDSHQAGNNPMPVVLTLIMRTRDWQALRSFSDGLLIGYARAAGATRYRVYRNLHDASEALLVAELPDHDALSRLYEAGALFDSWQPDERV